ncbi:MAG: phage terminase small subunit P27 family [Planctomycetaceae bacterium]
MGERGPLPKPTQRKILDGNPGKRPLPIDEPLPAALSEIPPPPDWLSPIGIQAWNYVAEELSEVNMLHRLDLATLELFSVSYSNWRAMVKAVKEVGYVKTFYDDEGNEKYSQPTVESSLMLKFGSEVNRLSKVLGIGPAHRVGLKTIEVGGREEFDNPVLAILHGDHPLPSPTYERPAVSGRVIKKEVAKKTPVKKAPAKKAATKRPAKKRGG